MSLIEPQITAVEHLDTGVELSLFVSNEIEYFKGHFDELPILPGVVQLDWAVLYAKQYLNLAGAVKQISVLKFQKLLRPDTHVKLLVTSTKNSKFAFKFYIEESIYSSGKVQLECE